MIEGAWPAKNAYYCGYFSLCQRKKLAQSFAAKLEAAFTVLYT